MIPIPLHSNKKLLLAFEWGVILADVAKKQKRALTPELIKRAEEVIIKEYQRKNATQLAGEMEVILLAIFETN